MPITVSIQELTAAFVAVGAPRTLRAETVRCSTANRVFCHNVTAGAPVSTSLTFTAHPGNHFHVCQTTGAGWQQNGRTVRLDKTVAPRVAGGATDVTITVT